MLRARDGLAFAFAFAFALGRKTHKAQALQDENGVWLPSQATGSSKWR